MALIGNEFNEIGFSQLIRRAQEQRDRVEELRLQVAKSAFAG
jgi:hypothetical protein